MFDLFNSVGILNNNQIRSSSRYVSNKDIKSLMGSPKERLSSNHQGEKLNVMFVFKEKRKQIYPRCIKI